MATRKRILLRTEADIVASIDDELVIQMQIVSRKYRAVRKVMMRMTFQIRVQALE
jgi:hypothetical protein